MIPAETENAERSIRFVRPRVSQSRPPKVIDEQIRHRRLARDVGVAQDSAAVDRQNGETKIRPLRARIKSYRAKIMVLRAK